MAAIVIIIIIIIVIVAIHHGRPLARAAHSDRARPIRWTFPRQDNELPAITVARLQPVSFEWAGVDADHDVWQFYDRQAYYDCDFSRAVKIGEQNDTQWVSQIPGQFYFGCPVRTHCAHGMRVRVNVM